MEEIPFYEDSIFWIILLVVLAIYVLIWLARRYAEGKRRSDMKAFADSKMYTYREDDDALNELIKSAHLGSRGRKHKVANILSGSEHGTEFQLFDHFYLTGYGRYTKRHHTSAVLYNSARLQIPEFSIRKRVTLDKLSHNIRKAAKVELNNSDAFNKKYHALAGGEHEIHLVQELLDGGKAADHAAGPLYNVDARQGQMLVYRDDKRFKMAEIEAFVRDAHVVFGRFASSSTWN